MSFRDDATASLQRIAALEEENQALRDEVQTLRDRIAKLRAGATEDKDAIIVQLMEERDALAAQLEAAKPKRDAGEEPFVSSFERTIQNFAKRHGMTGDE